MNSLTSRTFEDLAQHTFLGYIPTSYQYVLQGSDKWLMGCCCFGKVLFHPFAETVFSIQLSLISTVGKCLLPVLNSQSSVYVSYEAYLIAFLMFMAYLSSLLDDVLRIRIHRIHLSVFLRVTV